jgi:hypothetical protein
MTRDYIPTPFRTRALLAVVSTLLSTLVLGSVAGLASHYGERYEMAGAERPVVAQR